MLRPLLFLFSLLLILPVAFSQSKEEVKFLEKQADRLHDYAEDAYKAGFPKIAKNVWLMLLSEYEPDHAKARKALGYEKVGDAWSMKPGFVYKKEDKPDPAAAKKLQKQWDKVSEKIAGEHKKMAQQYEKAGRTDMARRHFEKVIFFNADDEEAQKALEHREVAGLTGTDLEQTLYKRSITIADAVEVQARQDYEVSEVDTESKHEFLEKAKVKYVTVTTEHFTIRGDFEPELLQEAGRYAERAIRVLEVAYDGFKGFRDDPKYWIRDWAMFKDKDTYVQVLQANAELFDPARLQFIIEQTSGSQLVDNDNRLYLKISAPQNEQGIYDSAVRNVARAYSGFNADALQEGIGHTFVGMMFNNNRRFLVDRETQLRTTTGEEDLDKYSPNMDTWKDLALEQAWQLSEGTPAAKLPLITADKFPDDARIKSWSFCDYLVRRAPSLLLDLNRMQDQRHPITVEEKFTEQHDGLSIAQLEKEWKDFWTGASPVMKAIQAKTPPLSSVSKDVKKWLEAFNKARQDVIDGTPPVSWSDAYSGRCREHVEYLLLNEEERGPGREQMQNIELEGGSHLGDMFAQMALICTDAGKPKAVFKKWRDYPGYRDALISNRLKMIGLYSQDGILVMDCIRGVGRAPAGSGGMVAYPVGSREAYPTKVKVAELGPELQDLLEKNGLGEATEVGYPISLHQFGNGGLAGNPSTYKCKVTILGKEVEGILHHADGGFNRRTSAAGMVVFYPIKPLRKGVEVEVIWTFETDGHYQKVEKKFKT